MNVQTRRATTADLDPSSDVLGRAFADFPWTRWAVDARDHVTRITALQRLTLEHIGLAFGDVWVTTVDEEVRSVAVWLDSGVDIPAHVMTDLDPGVAELEGDRHIASQAAEAELVHWRPSERHLWLGTVGTDPSHQGRGLASRTLKPALTEAVERDIEAFLETSSKANVDFYVKRGFVVADHTRIAGDGPDVWLMRRPVSSR